MTVITTVFRGLMLVLGASVIVLIAISLHLAGAGAAELTAGVLVLASLPLTLSADLVFQRFDLWPTFLVMLSLAALLWKRRTLGLAALGVGAAAKLYPVAFVPLAILARRGRDHVLRDLAVFSAAALVLVVPFAIVAPRGVGHVGWLLVRRPLHVESLGGSVLLVAHRLGGYKPTIYLDFAAGSWDLARPAAKAVAIVSSLGEAGALLTVWFLFARGRRGRRELLLAFAAAVLGFVAFGKVFSPQYLVWVAAAVPLALGRVRSFALAATVGAAIVTRYIYVYAYDDLVQADAGASWLMFARNLLLVAVFCALVLELKARDSSAPSSAAVHATRSESSVRPAS